MGTYNIKISGEGTAQEVAEALRNIADAITAAAEGEHEVAELDGAEWEGSVLMTEISHI